MTALAPLVAPWPQFGGKGDAAAEVWARLGDVENYVEAFAGSLAVLLRRPHAGRVETVNDLDGLICNAWRAIQADPDGVALAADWPVSELDLHARHLALLARRDELTARLGADPEFYDARLAGWWIWGACCWIGSGWCSGRGPWIAEDGKLVKRAKGAAAPGVRRKLPHLNDDGRGVRKPGVWKQLPHLHGIGQGIHKPGISRQLPHLVNDGQGIHKPNGGDLAAWFRRLSDRLRRVRVVCGDWKRVTGPSVTHKHLACRDRGTCGVFLDPPYALDERDGQLYTHDATADNDIAAEVRAWCAANDQTPNLRIVLAGYAGEGHEELEARGWRCVPWWRDGFLAGGYGKQSGEHQAHRERLWCSPTCLDPAAPAERQLGLFEVTP